MRFLHTGDWHVGKGLAGRNRAEEHRAVLAEITAIAAEHEVDLILVAGDLFDTSSPSPEAEDIVYEALLALSKVAGVVVISGNHDNERRLSAVAPLLDLASVTVRPDIRTGAEPFIFETQSGERAQIALLPWLSQRHIVRAEHLMRKDADELSGDFNQRMRRIIELLTAPFSDETVNIVLGHVTIAGSELGGGERTAQTIFDYYVDATAFPATAHYVALGHIHKMQPMAGACPIYYCGSPLQLDFSDKDDGKHVLVVEAHPGTPAEVTEIPLTAGRRLRTIEGTLDGLRTLAGSTGDDFLRVRLREPGRAGLNDEVRELFVDAVQVKVDPTPTDHDRPADRLERAGTSPVELFTEYLADRDIDDDRLVKLFGELYEEASR
ncbi:MAG: metallophosphoesterase family protein [Actinomycetota bacterium]